MTFRVNGLDKIAVTLRYPAQDKKCGSATRGSQDIENFAGIALDTAFVTIPIFIADNALKGRDLVILFHVNG